MPLTLDTTPTTPFRIPKTSQNITTFYEKLSINILKYLNGLAVYSIGMFTVEFNSSPIESFCWEWEIKMVTSIIRRQEFETFIHDSNVLIYLIHVYFKFILTE